MNFLEHHLKTVAKNGDVFVDNGHSFVFQDGVWVDSEVATDEMKTYYDEVYANEKGKHWLQGLNRSNIFKRVLEYISLSYRRERFFRRHLPGGNSSARMLDIACGAGRDYLANKGIVVGLDVSKEPLMICASRYNMTVQANATQLPFADHTFDYVLSSDFFGHLTHEDKDKVMAEIYRVLKPGGKTIHVIENDSKNIWFRIAHQYPNLFKKYFIDEIGGHIGLELPDDCIRRWEQHKFIVTKKKKIWGIIWPIQDYARMFGNDFNEHSVLVKYMVKISRLLGKHMIVKTITNIMLNPVNSIVESLTPLNNGQGLMILAHKPMHSVEQSGESGAIDPYSFSSDSSGTHMLLASPVLPNSEVLDIGCASGYLGGYLIREKQCTVWGIEPEARRADQARACGYEEVLALPVEDALKDQLLQQKTFDTIIAGDVLEHVMHPEAVLETLHSRIKKDGQIIISLPNVAHYSVRWELFSGKWRMTDAGILDRTHVHFYTRETALNLIKQSGYEVTSVRPRGDLERWFRKINMEAVGKKILFLFPGLFAVQFVFTARPRQ